MGLEKLKIQESEISTYGVVAAPDRLSGTAQENKAVFDRLIRAVVAQKFNDFVDQVIAEIESIEVPPKPVKGEDYWTEEDQAAVIEAAAQLLTPPALTAFSVLEGENVTTVVNTFADGSTETIAIAFNDRGKPIAISVDGTQVSGAWAEV